MTSSTRSHARPARRLATRIGSGIAVAGAVAALSFAGAGSASATQSASQQLTPGQGVCTSAQYGSYQVRGTALATGQGAKFKLVRNGEVVLNTPSRAPSWAPELRTAYGTFPGPGYYSVCAQNTGTGNTTVSLRVFTDAEL